MNAAVRPVAWIGSSRRDVRSFPQPVRREIGQALYAAQQGETDPAAKPLKGFGGRAVLEIIADYGGDTWRAVYTVRFQEAIYVLHAFQKKSKHGIATPKKEIDLVRRRLAEAERIHTERQN
ncbi:MAG: type II toxin-antitoxin system RelE/ParE family toxin [Candidatus Binataceae bacterium]